jgi:sorting nexin-5/6/32
MLNCKIPPSPPKPDFDSSREKLQRLTEGEASMTKEEFDKMKQELESEYLAMFKKTVQMHEVFLSRLAAHPAFKHDSNFRIFLEYSKDLNVRSKNTKEKFGGLVKSISKNADELRLGNQKDTDEFFESQKKFLTEYNAKIKEACTKVDRMTHVHRSSFSGLFFDFIYSLLLNAVFDKKQKKILLIATFASRAA